MLGTNDLKRSFNLKAFEIAHGLGVLLTVATQFEPKISEILLVSPPYIVETPDVDISRAVYRNRWN
jgi:predicted alpha/beta hydrolase family esterase